MDNSPYCKCQCSVYNSNGTEGAEVHSLNVYLDPITPLVRPEGFGYNAFPVHTHYWGVGKGYSVPL